MPRFSRRRRSRTGRCQARAPRPREAAVSSVQAYASRTGWIMLAAIVMFAVGALQTHLGHQLPRRQPQGERPHRRSVRGQHVALGNLGSRDRGARDLGLVTRCLAAVSSAGSSRTLWAILVIVNSFLIIGIAPWFAAGDDHTRRARHLRPRFDAARESRDDERSVGGPRRRRLKESETIQRLLKRKPP